MWLALHYQALDPLFILNTRLVTTPPASTAGVASIVWTAIVPDEPSRAKGLCVGTHPPTQPCTFTAAPPLLIPSVLCTVCKAYQVHSTRLLQPCTSAYAYGVVSVLDIVLYGCDTSGGNHQRWVMNRANLPSSWWQQTAEYDGSSIWVNYECVDIIQVWRKHCKWGKSLERWKEWSYQVVGGSRLPIMVDHQSGWTVSV